MAKTHILYFFVALVIVSKYSRGEIISASDFCHICSCSLSNVYCTELKSISSYGLHVYRKEGYTLKIIGSPTPRTLIIWGLVYDKIEKMFDKIIGLPITMTDTSTTSYNLWTYPSMDTITA
jgi:hypothetical protein